jgi:hypothetical protein
MVESREPACHSGPVEEKPTHQHCRACGVLDEADGITDM